MVRIGKLTTLLLLVFINFGGTTFNKKSEKNDNCTATLQVQKNRDVKSVRPGNDVYYYLVLTNTSSSTKTFKLDKESLKESCDVGNNKTTKNRAFQSNVSLSARFRALTVYSTKYSDFNQISLKSGESRTVEVRLSAAKDVSSNRWSCTRIKVLSLECKEVLASRILKTYITNPEAR